MNRLICQLVLLLLLPVCLCAHPPIKVMTEPLPPFNYFENGDIVGISADVVRTIFDQVDYPMEGGDIQLYPWARAYHEVQVKSGTALFSTARTDEREGLFQWVGPLIEVTLGVVAKKDRHIKIDSADDLSAYRIGTVRESAPEQLLLKRGVKIDNLDRLILPEPNIKKLETGRIDLFVFNLQVVQYLMAKLGIDVNEYETVYTLKQVGLYVAFHIDTDPELVKRLQKALDQLKHPGADGISQYDIIIEKYLGGRD
jgi:polar amino acid transport system substrate-binding protein